MKEYTQKPKQESQTIQSKTKAANQVSLAKYLAIQRKADTIQFGPYEDRMAEIKKDREAFVKRQRKIQNAKEREKAEQNPTVNETDYDQRINARKAVRARVTLQFVGFRRRLNPTMKDAITEYWRNAYDITDSSGHYTDYDIHFITQQGAYSIDDKQNPTDARGDDRILFSLPSTDNGTNVTFVRKGNHNSLYQ